MRVLFVSLLLVSASAALGQTSSPDDPISTSRPSFGDSPTIVPVRRLQLESGLSYYRRGGEEPERSTFGEALLRYGLAPRVELRLLLPNYDVTGGGGPNGFDNTFVGASFYLGKPLGIDVGIIPGVYVPTGDRNLRYPTVTPTFTLNGQRALGHGDTVGATLGQTYTRHETQSLAALNLVHPLGGALTGFVEYAVDFAPGERPEQYGHVGLQLLATRTSQFDVHGGVGLNASTPHAFVGAGYSVRF